MNVLKLKLLLLQLGYNKKTKMKKDKKMIKKAPNTNICTRF